MTRVPVLMYHSISAQAMPRFRRFTLPAADFAAQMSFLAEHGYTPLSAARYAAILRGADGGLPARPVVITFDDGFADFHQEALPILRRHGFAATLYVATAFVEGSSGWLRPEGEQDRPMLTWAQLREIAAAGIEVGAHAHTHADLDAVDPETARNEIAISQELLARQLGAPPQTFAYPFGHYDQCVRALVEAAGYIGACAVRNAISHTGDDPFAIARLTIPRDTTIARFESLLEGHGLPLAAPGERTLVRAWRLVRRVRARLTRREQPTRT